jgi:hypothetical protein
MVSTLATSLVVLPLLHRRDPSDEVKQLELMDPMAVLAVINMDIFVVDPWEVELVI